MTNFNVETLRALLARVEAATGPDRKIDAAIAVTIDGGPKSFTSDDAPDRTRGSYGAGIWFTDADNYHVLSKTVRCAALITASIDAAVALIERVLPEWIWDVTSTGTSWIMAGDESDLHVPAKGATPALAILAAIFRALIHIEEGRAND